MMAPLDYLQCIHFLCYLCYSSSDIESLLLAPCLININYGYCLNKSVAIKFHENWLKLKLAKRSKISSPACVSNVLLSKAPDRTLSVCIIKIRKSQHEFKSYFI
jgi:hypothetical protein